MVLKIGPEAKPDLPLVPSFYLVLGNFPGSDWPSVLGSIGWTG